ncbi:Transcriptional regulator SlyA [Thalassoglobus polymorphus]|uniref:Transcriptional regulator SlyA n=2 Tax=Thalassoglobus polymorphus TaxID=2527994 RepID=A0A517QJV5_9PLAN|nr:Transcriptional regulator SlyA [Thalassoglobus polymorphus]
MLKYDWENSIGYWVCTTSHALRKALDSHLAREGITMRQWEVLAWLSASGNGCQSTIADQLGIEANTLAGVLTRMEKAGLLTRRNCPDDRRKNTIHPTAKAEKLWKRVASIQYAMREQAVQGLSVEDLALFKSMCERIYNNVTDLNAKNPGFDPCKAADPFGDKILKSGSEDKTVT